MCGESKKTDDLEELFRLLHEIDALISEVDGVVCTSAQEDSECVGRGEGYAEKRA